MEDEQFYRPKAAAKNTRARDHNPQLPTTVDEQFIDEADLARMFGVSVRVLSKLARKHRLLRRGRVQRVYYRKDAARDFIAWYMGDAQQGRLSRQASASARAGWSTRRKRAA